jgi:Cu+-exporting ATPase
MLKERKQQEIRSCNNTTCECDSLGEEREEYTEEHEYEGKHHDRTKLLITFAIAMTVSIILLETFYHSALSDYISLALATPVQIILGRPFYLRFYKTMRFRKPFTTDTLVVLSTTVAYTYGIISVLIGQEIHFFEASSSVLTIFTIGDFLERRIIRTTSSSLRNLLALKPKTVVVVRGRNNITSEDKTQEDGGRKEEIVINADDIILGDIVVAKPGEKIATDGIVIHGQSSIDESMITGESIPVDKKIGDKVIGGTINKNGYIQFKATSVGNDTVLANIIEMIKKAKRSKAPIQRIADRAVQFFIPIVLSVAIISSLYWILLSHEPVSFGITVFATVLVVSCPCALGIATPMVVSLGIDRASREGILIKGGEYLEKLASINTIVFDKTGTLTKGQPEVTDIIPNEGYTEFEVLQLALSAEIRSEHPIAQAIVQKASEQAISALEVSEFKISSGQGILAKTSNKRIFVGSPAVIMNNFESSKIIPKMFKLKVSELETEGKTVVAVLIENELAGFIAVADTLREDAKEIIDAIKETGKEVILMSGDNERTTHAIAKKLGISDVLAQILPEDKAHEIRKLQNRGRNVAMIGDGINDAPGLTQADIGIAMGSGTDIAMSAGNIILVKSDLKHVLSAFRICEYSLKKIKQNLTMSFAYNAITISIAAGLLYGFTQSLILTPTLAALGWIVSDSAVFGNSLLVRKYTTLADNVPKVV